jgi:hypothetical protein
VVVVVAAAARPLVADNDVPTELTRTMIFSSSHPLLVPRNDDPNFSARSSTKTSENVSVFFESRARGL